MSAKKKKEQSPELLVTDVPESSPTSEVNSEYELMEEWNDGSIDPGNKETPEASPLLKDTSEGCWEVAIRTPLCKNSNLSAENEEGNFNITSDNTFLEDIDSQGFPIDDVIICDELASPDSKKVSAKCWELVLRNSTIPVKEKEGNLNLISDATFPEANENTDSQGFPFDDVIICDELSRKVDGFTPKGSESFKGTVEEVKSENIKKNINSKVSIVKYEDDPSIKSSRDQCSNLENNAQFDSKDGSSIQSTHYLSNQTGDSSIIRSANYFRTQPAYDSGIQSTNYFGTQPAYDTVIQSTDYFGTQPPYDTCIQSTDYFGTQPPYDTGIQSTDYLITQPAYGTVIQSTDYLGTQPAYDTGIQSTEYLGTQPAYETGIQSTEYLRTQQAYDTVIQSTDYLETQPAYETGIQPTEYLGTQPANETGIQSTKYPRTQPAYNTGIQSTNYLRTQPEYKTSIQSTNYLSGQRRFPNITILSSSYFSIPPTNNISIASSNYFSIPSKNNISIPSSNYFSIPPKNNISIQSTNIKIQPSENINLQPTDDARIHSPRIFTKKDVWDIDMNMDEFNNGSESDDDMRYAIDLEADGSMESTSDIEADGSSGSTIDFEADRFMGSTSDTATEGSMGSTNGSEVDGDLEFLIGLEANGDMRSPSGLEANGVIQSTSCSPESSSCSNDLNMGSITSTSNSLVVQNSTMVFNSGWNFGIGSTSDSEDDGELEATSDSGDDGNVKATNDSGNLKSEPTVEDNSEEDEPWSQPFSFDNFETMFKEVDLGTIKAQFDLFSQNPSKDNQKTFMEECVSQSGYKYFFPVCLYLSRDSRVNQYLDIIFKLVNSWEASKIKIEMKRSTLIILALLSNEKCTLSLRQRMELVQYLLHLIPKLEDIRTQRSVMRRISYLMAKVVKKNKDEYSNRCLIQMTRVMETLFCKREVFDPCHLCPLLDTLLRMPITVLFHILPRCFDRLCKVADKGPAALKQGGDARIRFSGDYQEFNDDMNQLFSAIELYWKLCEGCEVLLDDFFKENFTPDAVIDHVATVQCYTFERIRLDHESEAPFYKKCLEYFGEDLTNRLNIRYPYTDTPSFLATLFEHCDVQAFHNRFMSDEDYLQARDYEEGEENLYPEYFMRTAERPKKQAKLMHAFPLLEETPETLMGNFKDLELRCGLIDPSRASKSKSTVPKFLKYSKSVKAPDNIDTKLLEKQARIYAEGCLKRRKKLYGTPLD